MRSLLLKQQCAVSWPRWNKHTLKNNEAFWLVIVRNHDSASRQHSQKLGDGCYVGTLATWLFYKPVSIPTQTANYSPSEQQMSQWQGEGKWTRGEGDLTPLPLLFQKSPPACSAIAQVCVHVHACAKKKKKKKSANCWRIFATLCVFTFTCKIHLTRENWGPSGLKWIIVFMLLLASVRLLMIKPFKGRFRVRKRELKPVCLNQLPSSYSSKPTQSLFFNQTAAAPVTSV